MAKKTGEAKYQVTLDGVGFSGHRKETKEMTEAELKEWFATIQHRFLFDEIVKAKPKMKVFNVALGIPTVLWIKVV